MQSFEVCLYLAKSCGYDAYSSIQIRMCVYKTLVPAKGMLSPFSLDPTTSSSLSLQRLSFSSTATMACIFREMASLSREAKKNAKAVFSRDAKEEIIDEHGRKTIVRNKFQWPDNPFPILGRMSALQWAFFICGTYAFLVEMADTFALTVQITKIAKFYKADKASVASAITFANLAEPIGSIVFGVASDMYGRKYPFIIICLCIGFIQIGTVYGPTLVTFAISRAIFGFFMGAAWSLAACTAMEEADVEARGILSGLFQWGSCLGFIIVCVVNIVVGPAPHTWVTAYWVGAVMSVTAALFRLVLPESSIFLKEQKIKASQDPSTLPSTMQKFQIFWQQFKEAVKQEWRVITYCMMLVTAFHITMQCAIGVYTTFLLNTKLMSNTSASTVSIIMKSGGMVGGPLIGWISQSIGRRRSLVFCGICSLVLIPWWIVPDNAIALASGGFIFIAFVQGIGGMLPIHLNELSPAKFRVLITGLGYQFGSIVSSPSNQVVTILAEKHKMRNKAGIMVESFGPVMAIVTAFCILNVVILGAVGPERRSSHFESVAPAGVIDKEEDDRRSSISSFEMQRDHFSRKVVGKQ